MKSPLLYLLEVLFCSGILLVLYRVLLVRRVSYRGCRRYLTAALALSVVIPALDIPLYPAPEPVPVSVVETALPDPVAADIPEPASAPRLSRELLLPESVDWDRWLYVNIIFLIRTQISVGRWWGLARSAKGPVEGHEMFTNTSVFQKLELGMCPFS